MITVALMSWTETPSNRASEVAKTGTWCWLDSQPPTANLWLQVLFTTLPNMVAFDPDRGASIVTAGPWMTPPPNRLPPHCPSHSGGEDQSLNPHSTVSPWGAPEKTLGISAGSASAQLCSRWMLFNTFGVAWLHHLITGTLILICMASLWTAWVMQAMRIEPGFFPEMNILHEMGQRWDAVCLNFPFDPMGWGLVEAMVTGTWKRKVQKFTRMKQNSTN